MPQSKGATLAASKVRLRTNLYFIFTGHCTPVERVEKGNVDERTTVQLSPMPDNFVDQVSEADFYNLLAFLLKQRSPVEKREEKVK